MAAGPQSLSMLIPPFSLHMKKKEGAADASRRSTACEGYFSSSPQDAGLGISTVFGRPARAQLSDSLPFIYSRSFLLSHRCDTEAGPQSCPAAALLSSQLSASGYRSRLAGRLARGCETSACIPGSEAAR